MSNDDDRTTKASRGVSKTQAGLIVFSVVVTMALYVGIWEERLATQKIELERVASENQATIRRLEEAQKRIRSLSAALAEPASAQPDIPASPMEGSDDE